MIHDIDRPQAGTGGETYQLLEALRSTETSRASTDNKNIDVTETYGISTFLHISSKDPDRKDPDSMA